MTNLNTPRVRDEALRDSFINTMGLAACGVTIVTTCNDNEYFGATVSAMCSVTADEPTLLVCVFKESRLAQKINASGKFAVSLLSSEQQKVSDLFAGRFGDLDRFAENSWTSLHTGSPVLAESLGAFDCEVSEQLDQGTHTIFIGRVVDTLANAGNALIYTQRNYHDLQPLVREAS